MTNGLGMSSGASEEHDGFRICRSEPDQSTALSALREGDLDAAVAIARRLNAVDDQIRHWAARRVSLVLARPGLVPLLAIALS
jgi:hypothetical protein